MYLPDVFPAAGTYDLEATTDIDEVPGITTLSLGVAKLPSALTDSSELPNKLTTPAF